MRRKFQTGEELLTSTHRNDIIVIEVIVMKKNELVVHRKNKVEKRNIVNEMRTYNMGLEELRIFNTYLAKINARDPAGTRAVRFPVSYFQELMCVDKININSLKAVSHRLLQKIVDIPDDDGGFTAFQLFKVCIVKKDDSGEWYMDIDAHDLALPLMFEFKDKYFTYGLENVSALKSANQIRMYEILKQYENTGFRVVTIGKLKEYLGILPIEYAEYKIFKRDVLEVCRKAIDESTDITFTYEPHGRKGRGGKILALKFLISQNKKNLSILKPDEQLGECRVEWCDVLADESPVVIVDEEQSAVDERKNEKKIVVSEVQEKPREYTCVEDYDDYELGYIAQACKFEFNELEMAEIKTYLDVLVPHKKYFEDEVEQYKYLLSIYSTLNRQADIQKIKSRFGYIIGILKVMRTDFEKEQHKRVIEAMKEFQ
ncbi:Protein involved in initiation of plasmid replication [Bacteroidales bacterium Barb7]|nr:Protein involved in initiation of plasmid replication [Bacteroidales bacterium Barb7]